MCAQDVMMLAEKNAEAIEHRVYCLVTLTQTFQFFIVQSQVEL